MKTFFDLGTIVVIIVTILLFTFALFVKGLSKDLLLEAGVLLVSVKLIMMAYRNNLNYREIKKEMEEINQFLRDKLK